MKTIRGCMQISGIVLEIMQQRLEIIPLLIFHVNFHWNLVCHFKMMKLSVNDV